MRRRRLLGWFPRASSCLSGWWMGCEKSGTLTALRFVVVLGTEVEGAEYLEDAELFAPLNVFGQGCSDCVFLGFVVTYAAGLFGQVVVDGEIGCYV